MSKLRLVVAFDASFETSPGKKSHFCYVILMADNKRRSLIVHQASCRCRRVSRSVMAAEIHALVNVFNNEYITRALLVKMLRHSIDIEAYVHSQKIFNIIAKNNNTSERRLQFDVFALRESYRQGELKKRGWNPGTKMRQMY